jgi:hypothetical protein
MIVNKGGKKLNEISIEVFYFFFGRVRGQKLQKANG